MGKDFRTLFICALILVLSFVGAASARTWTVDGDGGADFTGIQDAVDAANAGDTIFVNSGTYYENVDVNKQLILRGVNTGGGKPVVDAGGSDNAITLSADRITLEGFNATNSGSASLRHDAGIHVLSSYNTITSNTATNNHNYGIAFNSSCNNTISGNTVRNNDYGIRSCRSHSNTITDNDVNNNKLNSFNFMVSNSNTITNNNFNSNKGLGFSLGSSSNNNITGNTFVNDGLLVQSSFQNTVEDNIVNGKPLVYLEDASGYKVTDAGQVILVNCNNIRVENQDLSDTNIGLQLLKTEDSIIRNNNVSNNHHNGIHLYSSCNNAIAGNAVRNNHWYGINLWSSSNNAIAGNNVSNNSHTGICLHDDARNNNITGNTVSNSGYGISLGYRSNSNTITSNDVTNNRQDGIQLYSRNNNITGNNFNSNKWHGINLVSSCNNNITGNTFVNDGLFVDKSYQNTVEDNIVNGKPLLYLEERSDIKVKDAGQVILVNCNNITVENLDISNTSIGVELLKTGNSTISNNTFCNNYRGIFFFYSSNNNTVTGNNVCDNHDGIRLYTSCNNNTIRSNNAWNNKYGIHLYSSCNNNAITGNNITNNYRGIRLIYSSNNNIITCNNVCNSNYGINHYGSSNNKIYLNDFINNNNNVHSYESNNIWNSSDTIIYKYGNSNFTNYMGNYWDTYTGPDADNDGIGDTAYSIGSDEDNHPLMERFGHYFAPPENQPPIASFTHAPENPVVNQPITVSKLYTYPCTGTGWHSEHVAFYHANGTKLAEGHWTGYTGDWHNISFDESFTLKGRETYNYSIRTGSYPQIIHVTSKEVTGGTITCTEFVDANGKVYNGWIPAIRLE